MSSQTKSTTAYTVRHAGHSYRVIDPQGRKVSTYNYDPAEFAARRHAYREALADAEIRSTIAARQEREAPRELNAGRDPLLERLRARKAAYAEMKALAAIHSAHAPVDADGNVNWGSGPARKAVA